MSRGVRTEVKDKELENTPARWFAYPLAPLVLLWFFESRRLRLMQSITG